MNDAVVSPLPPAEPTASPVAFAGVRGDFRRLVTRGALLELVTLGFYRFWLATDMRRHLWSHTSVKGDAAEYTGTAKELLIGFLVALAILAPVYLVYFFIGLEAERAQAFASIPLVLFFFLFYQFAMYRARRYRLTRTIWRGVRFWMKGSGIAYALRAGLWMLLVIITAGLALPWYQAALERYKMQNSFYGDLPGGFAGTGWGLFKQVWWLWPVALLIVVVVGALGAATGNHFVIAVLPITTIMLLLPSVYSIYKACEWRWWAAGAAFGDVRFECKLSRGAFIGLYWKVIGWSLLILAALSAWIAGAIFGAIAVIGEGDGGAQAYAAIAQNPIFLITMALGYVICALAFGVVVRLYLRRDVWARVAASSVVYNLAAADNVAARG
ncbi:MAG: DUF898 family protein, partial [Rhizobiales bacterium]|nr:DUF898 family protein [Hyphomicrobiales bacterium]